MFDGANLLFSNHRLELAIGVLADRLAAPQFTAHQRVAYYHDQHRHHVRQQQEDYVVSKRTHLDLVKFIVT